MCRWHTAWRHNQARHWEQPGPPLSPETVTSCRPRRRGRQATRRALWQHKQLADKQLGPLGKAHPGPWPTALREISVAVLVSICVLERERERETVCDDSVSHLLHAQRWPNRWDFLSTVRKLTVWWICSPSKCCLVSVCRLLCVLKTTL